MEKAFFSLVCFVVIALLLWTKSTFLSVLVVGKTERLKLHRSHGGLFWAPKESGRGQTAGSTDLFVLRAGEPLSPRHVCSLRLFTAEALCDRNEERSGRMLCANSPGECVGTPRLQPGVFRVYMCLCLSRLLGWGVGATTRTNSCH